MGRRNKSYYKDLHQQAYERLQNMQAFGESKNEAKKDNTASNKIFSFSTYETYWKCSKRFVKWVNNNHPECTTLSKAGRYVNEWLQHRVDYVNADGSRLSSRTIHTEAAAMSKLFGIREGTKDKFVPPRRERDDITRSRNRVERDKHFSVVHNAELINFCQGTGLRRSGVESVKGRDLFTRGEIEAEIETLESKKGSTREDKQRMAILKDTRRFIKPGQNFFVQIKEKGGRVRMAPIIGNHVQEIVALFRNTAPNDKVWKSVNSNADIHSYRSDYATNLYKSYAREIKDIPYDRRNKGSGKLYQSEVYNCRNDQKGKKLDKKAMLICSKALGHNRIEIVARHYLKDV